jgi:hypothetical protein
MRFSERGRKKVRGLARREGDEVGDEEFPLVGFDFGALEFDGDAGGGFRGVGGCFDVGGVDGVGD